jgi:hypothetical protein
METCPNCGSIRPDRFCSHCGQNDRNYMRGAWSVVYEFFREMFELDSRLFRTLRSLLFRPGHLSSEFSRNRRAAYMSPVRLYLFTSFLFFLVLSISAGGWLRNLDMSDAELQMNAGDDPAAADSARAVADSVLAAVDSVLVDRGLPAGLRLAPLVDSVLADSALAADAPADSTLADGAPAGPAGEPAAVPEARVGAGDEQGGEAVDSVQLAALKARLLPEHARKVDDIVGRPGEPLAKKVVRGLAGSVDPDERASGVPGWLSRYGRSLLIDLFHDPRAFLQQAIGNLPIAMFFLLPVFAMILGVCYFRRKRFFVEHLVFGMHIHTFLFLMLAAALLVPGETTGNWVKLSLVLVSPLYVLIAMRRFYGEGWGRTLIKGFVVWNLYSFALFPGLMLAFLIRT